MGFDAELSQRGAFGDVVAVYAADAADPQPYTSWEAGVAAGQQWREERLGSGLVVRVPKFEGDSAQVGPGSGVPGWGDAGWRVSGSLKWCHKTRMMVVVGVRGGQPR